MSPKTPAEIEQIIRSEVKGLGNLPIESLTSLSETTEGTWADQSQEPDDGIYNPPPLLWKDFQLAAIDLQEALKALLSEAGPAGWEQLIDWHPGIRLMRSALENLSRTKALTLNPAASPATRGPKIKDQEYYWATHIANDVIDALKGAGYKKPLSRTSDNGPVARIGSKIMASVLRRNVLPPSTFAGWVKKASRMGLG